MALLAHWPLDDYRCLNRITQKGTLTTLGVSYESTSPIGGCTVFNDSGYKSIYQYDFTGTGQMSISFWIYLTDTFKSAYKNIFSIGYDNNGDSTSSCLEGLWLVRNDNTTHPEYRNSLLYHKYNSTGGTGEIALNGQEFKNRFNKWTHVVLTLDRNNPELCNYYIDGIRKENTKRYRTPLKFNKGYIYLGTEPDYNTASDYPMMSNDAMCDFFVFDHVMSQEEIDSIYNRRSKDHIYVKQDNHLIAHWPLTDTYDISGNNRHLTNYNCIVGLSKLGKGLYKDTIDTARMDCEQFNYGFKGDFTITSWLKIGPKDLSEGHLKYIFSYGFLHGGEPKLDYNGFAFGCGDIPNLPVDIYRKFFIFSPVKGSTEERLLISKNEYPINKWVYMTLICKNGRMKLYIDDILEFDEVFIYDYDERFDVFSLFNRGDSKTNSINQIFLQDFRIYSRALEYHEIKKLTESCIIYKEFTVDDVRNKNLASGAESDVLIRGGISSIVYKNMYEQKWKILSLNGTTTTGSGRKGVAFFPSTPIITDSSFKYSMSVRVRITNDNPDNYYVGAVFSGLSQVTRMNRKGDLYYLEGVDVPGGVSFGVYATTDDYNINNACMAISEPILVESPYLPKFQSDKNMTIIKSDFGIDNFMTRLDVSPEGSIHKPSGVIYRDNQNRWVRSCKKAFIPEDFTLYADFEISKYANFNSPINIEDDIHNGLSIAICETNTFLTIQQWMVTYSWGNIVTDFVLERNKRYKILINYKQSTKTMKIYVGNTLIKEIVNQVDIKRESADCYIWSGMDPVGGDERFNGTVYAVGVWASILNPTDIVKYTKKYNCITKNRYIDKYIEYKENSLFKLVTTNEIKNGMEPRILYNEIDYINGSVLLTALAGDAFTGRSFLNEPILAGEEYVIECQTVISTNVAADAYIELEVYLFNGSSTDGGQHHYIRHSLSEGIFRNQRIVFKNPRDYPLNMFRIDCNIAQHGAVLKDLRIYKNKPRLKRDLLTKLNLRTFYTNLLDYTKWEPNTIIPSSYGDFYRIGTPGVDDARILIRKNPWGIMDAVWAHEFNESGNVDADGSGPDGGFDTGFCAIDNTKKYRISVWMKREKKGRGSIYMGPSNSSVETRKIYAIANNSHEGNPYMFSGNYMVSDEWLLLVGFVYPSNTPTQLLSDYQGMYNINGEVVVNSINWRRYKFGPNTNELKMRTYLYYSPTVDERVYWYRPRIDLCDGTEPSLNDLLKGYDHQSTIESNEVVNPFFPPDNQFLEIKRAHGAKWGLIFYHNINGGSTPFRDDIREFLRTNTTDKKSILYALPAMRDVNGDFEFLLEYDSYPGYNRWKQKSIFTKEAIDGYKKISLTWEGALWGGLAPAYGANISGTFVDGSPGLNGWYYSIGTKINYKGGSPGPEGRVETRGTYLWVRMPDEITMTKNKIVVDSCYSPKCKDRRLTDQQFIETKIDYGAKWGLIFYHNNRSGTVLFSDDRAEFLRTNTTDKKSILYLLEYMRDLDGNFEFLLEYDGFVGYNRWKQKSNPVYDGLNGYVPIHLDLTKTSFNGLEPYDYMATGSTLNEAWINGNCGSTAWWYGLGLRAIWKDQFGTTGVPGDGEAATAGTYLWVRIPD